MSERALFEAARERAEKSVALLESTEPEGMVSRPHICAWSDRLSIATRDVIALSAEGERLEALLRRYRSHFGALPDHSDWGRVS